MNVDSWQTQLRKGAAELVVLSLLKDRELYGIELLDRAGGNGGILSDGTLYPLLARLEREGKLAGAWALPDDARIPRKYYRLTAEGEALVAQMQPLWRQFSAFVTGAIEERMDERAPAAPRRTLAQRAGG
jgi:PadR family transcriptional regulator PadR